MNKTPSIKFNFIMNALLAVSAIVFPLITFPYASRVLLPIGTGKVFFAVSLISYFNMFAQLGIPTYGIRACAKVRDDKEELTRIVHELLFISLCMSLLSYLVLAITVACVPKLRAERWLYLVVSLTIVLNSIGVEWLYKALEQYTYITVRSIFFKLAAIGCMFLLIHKPGDYIAYGGITVLASSASYLCNLFHAHRYIGVRPVGGYNACRHLKTILIFFAMTCSTMIYTHLDTVMLGFMKADVDVGYYSAAVQIKTVLVSVTASLGNVLFPRSSYYVEHGQMDSFRKLSTKAFNFVFIAAPPLVLYFILYTPFWIGFLSGPAYTASIPAMRIIMPTVLLIGITNISGIQILLPLGRERVVLKSEIAGAVTDLLLNLILIPRYGAAGAAAGTLAAETVVLIVQYESLRNEIREIFREIQLRKIIVAIFLGCFSAIFTTEFLLTGFLSKWMNENIVLGCFMEIIISGLAMLGIYGIVLLITGEKLLAEARESVLKSIRNGKTGF